MLNTPIQIIQKHKLMSPDQCPQQPLIYSLKSNKNKNKNKKNKSYNKPSLLYTPKIIHQQKIVTYNDIEHLREWNSMCKRIKDCKSLQQRKKDRNDAIVYPPYLIRDISSDLKNQRNQRISNNIKNNNQKDENIEQDNNTIQVLNKEFMMADESQLPSPIFHKVKQQPTPIVVKQQIKKPLAINLPGQCSYGSVIKHIIVNKIYKANEIKILYSRMCHHYGQRQVEQIWYKVKQWLETGEKMIKTIAKRQNINK